MSYKYSEVKTWFNIQVALEGKKKSFVLCYSY